MPDVLLEYHVIGENVKVAAIDAETGFEVSIVGPVQAGRQVLDRIAVRKLRYMQARLKSETDGPDRGRLV